jgi:DNA primase small subunit
VSSMEERFARSLFSRYYLATALKLQPSPSSREWGFGSWDKKIESRHYAFASPDELAAYLRRNAPFYISHSSAYYEFPSARPMEKKNWLGADLIFDIDADQLNPPCLEKHGKGWVCDTCLSLAKEEAHKLIEDFLVQDFGFEKNEMTVNFSGNRGYHIHVSSEDVKPLSGLERREIADYITGKGIESSQFQKETHRQSAGAKTSRWEGPTPNDAGWRGRVAKGFISLLTEKKLERIMKESTAKRFYKAEGEVVAGIGRGNWDVVGLKDYEEVWGRLAKLAGVSLSDNIDQNVTFDTSKLIRMPDSLHGETGLAAKRTSDLDRFDPLKDAVVFGKNEVKVKIEKAQEIRIWGEVYGPFENAEVALPEAVALYFVCKRKAKLA